MIFDSPVGTEVERHSSKVWPGEWIDATGFGTYYNATGAWAYHTGADLNLNIPVRDSDANAPVYAVADGLVQYAGVLPVWGLVVVIKHDGVWSRYGHVENLKVKAGDGVTRGQQIAQIGNAGGRYPYHLHFDISTANLGEHPADWPGTDKARLLRDYRDPRQYISDHHDETIPKEGEMTKYRVGGDQHVHFRYSPDGQILGMLLTGTIVEGVDNGAGWIKIQINDVGGTPLTDDNDSTKRAVGYMSAKLLTPVVIPPVHNVVFTTSDNSITEGESTTLSWSGTDGASAIYLNGAPEEGPSKTITITPVVSTTYTLNVVYPGEPDIVKTLSVEVAPKPPVVVVAQIGMNTLASGAAIRDAYNRGCRFFTVMNDTDSANWAAAQPNTIVIYRQWWANTLPSVDQAMTMLNVPRLDRRIIRIGINECEGINGNDIRLHAAWDIELATRLKAQGAEYAAGTFPMGTPDYTNSTICNDIRQYYAPAYNSGLIHWDHHTYSPNMRHIYQGMASPVPFAMAPHHWVIKTGKVGRDQHDATWMEMEEGPSVAMATTLSGQYTEQDWFETRWHFNFTDCGFDVKSPSRVLSTETGMDEGGIGGFPAHQASSDDVVRWCRRYREISAAPVNGYPSPYIGGAIFQLGDTARWGGYDMAAYMPALQTQIWMR